MTYKEKCEGCESKKCKSAGCARVREGKERILEMLRVGIFLA